MNYINNDGLSDVLKLTLSDQKRRADEIKNYMGFVGSVMNIHANFDTQTFEQIGSNDTVHIWQLPGVKKCNVDIDYNITALEGEDGYDENGTVLYRVPKFYLRCVQLKCTDWGEYGYTTNEANYYISSVKKADYQVCDLFYDVDGNEVPYILTDLDEKIYDPYFKRFCKNGGEINAVRKIHRNAYYAKAYGFQPPYYTVIMGEIRIEGEETISTDEEAIAKLPLPTDPDEAKRPHSGWLYIVGSLDLTEELGYKHLEDRLYWWNPKRKKWARYNLPELDEKPIDIKTEVEEIKALLASGQEIPERDREILEAFVAKNQV